LASSAQPYGTARRLLSQPPVPHRASSLSPATKIYFKQVYNEFLCFFLAFKHPRTFYPCRLQPLLVSQVFLFGFLGLAPITARRLL